MATPDEGVALKAERLALGGVDRPSEGFSIGVRDWMIRGADGRYSLAATEGRYTLDIDLEETKVPVLHGGNGLLDMGPAGESFYYSRTRLRATGSLTIDGVSRKVSGKAWMDQQWGDFDQTRVGWDWFSLQMDDNTELMAFFLWDPDTRELIRVGGTYISADGTALGIGADDINMTPLGSWTSPTTTITYPMGWQLRVDPLGLTLTLEPAHLDAEFDASRIGAPVYWEGRSPFQGKGTGSPSPARASWNWWGTTSKYTHSRTKGWGGFVDTFRYRTAGRSCPKGFSACSPVGRVARETPRWCGDIWSRRGDSRWRRQSSCPRRPP